MGQSVRSLKGGDFILVLLGDSDLEEGRRPCAEVLLLGSSNQHIRPSRPPPPRGSQMGAASLTCFYLFMTSSKFSLLKNVLLFW